ncbi:MAG TPA: ACP S-malonyltransferase [Gemmatimonadales bacterium]|jgi:[acyl-carrier-protein] S-malonyltransferase|nr:ACP S-malonyltransferase [Gemmatimonadales bacterium]
MVTLLLFPGQGAQQVGMGKDLAAGFPAARETFRAIDEALGMPLSRTMWHGPADALQRTEIAQPAILAHSAAALAVVKERLGEVGGAAGHSLGEYSAYAAAGALPAVSAARLVRRRGELMQEAGTSRPGAMAVVLGLAAEEVRRACREASSAEEIAVAANLNAPDQTVVSGDPPAVARAGERCKAAGAKRVLPLKVSAAFHSPLMAPAARGLAAELDAAPFADPAFPVVANASARPVQSALEARRELAAQLTAPVRWVECVQALAALAPAGASRFVEIGPGTVLGGLLKRILPGAPYQSLGTAAEVERFLA